MLIRNFSLLAGIFLTLGAQTAPAQDWPTKPVKIVVPGAPGSSPDRVTRIVADRLSKQWHTPVVVENRPGGTTRVGTEPVVRSAPDGYTLLSTFGTHAMVRLLYPDTPYDPVEDFSPVVQFVTPESVFLVRADSPYRTMKELVDGVKKRKTPLNYANFGNGSSFHFYGLMVGRGAGIDVLPVPYKGEALQLTDLIGGHVESSFNSVGTALPSIREGKVRPLALVSNARSKTLPDLPTFAELGYAGMDNGGWFGLLAPAHTPKAIVDKIAADVNAILAVPEVYKVLSEQGLEPAKSTPESFTRKLRGEVRQWKQLIDEFGVKVD